MKRVKIGDRVIIDPTSEFYGQSEAVGVVLRRFDIDFMTVRFSDGYQNSYRDKDLIVVPKLKKKSS